MPKLTDRDKRRLTDAFEQAALGAGFKMQVRAQLGDELRFSDFAGDVATGTALNLVLDQAVVALRARGVKLDFGSGGGTWSDIKPDRYTVIIDGKKVYGAVSWDF